MRFIVFTFFLLLNTFSLFGQEDCIDNWVDKLESIHKLKNKLVLIHKNIENTCFPLVVVNGHPLSKDSSTYPFNLPKTVINHLAQEKIESLILLKNVPAQKLYGSAGKNGIVVISLKNERNLKKLRRSVLKDLRSRSKS